MGINKQQLRRLQTVYGQLVRRDNSLDASRLCRLQWASGLCQREVASFSELTLDEARHLIDIAQGILGVRVPAKRSVSRDQARRAGLDGRHDGKEFSSVPQIATAEDLARIKRLLEQMDWTQERLASWLASSHSPFSKRSNKSILTSDDANKVWWGLKRIAKGQGTWRKRT